MLDTRVTHPTLPPPGLRRRLEIAAYAALIETQAADVLPAYASGKLLSDLVEAGIAKLEDAPGTPWGVRLTMFGIRAEGAGPPQGLLNDWACRARDRLAGADT